MCIINSINSLCIKLKEYMKLSKKMKIKINPVYKIELLKYSKEKVNKEKKENMETENKEKENLNKSRIKVPFNLNEEYINLNKSFSLNLSINSDCNTLSFIEQILPNDNSLDSIQYYSRFENSHSLISSIKSSRKDVKYIPTLFKISSLKKEEIYFPENAVDNFSNFNNNNWDHNENNASVSVDIEILEEEKSFGDNSIKSKSNSRENVMKLRCNSLKNSQDL